MMLAQKEREDRGHYLLPAQGLLDRVGRIDAMAARSAP